MEVCSNCGELVDTLDEFTGWCEDCSPATSASLRRYLEVNADKLEFYITQGNSLYQAIDLIANPKNGHRPSCIICGSVIKHAPRSSVFCRKTRECRTYSRRYVYLYQKKGMSKAEALATILEQIS